jgi:hypothetical protein
LDLAFFRLGDGHVRHPQRLSGSLQDHRSHELILLTVPANFLILPNPTPRSADSGMSRRRKRRCSNPPPSDR